MKKITIQDIYRARPVVYKYLKPTPLFYNSQLSKETGAEIYIKYENHQPVGAFKVRGGLVRLSHLSEEEKNAGVCTASTGNHGQSIAFAARAYGIKARIFAPENNNPDKTRAMKDLGAEVVLEGSDFDEARMICEEYSSKTGAVHIHVANEPHLLAGVGTMGIEMFDSLPDIDILINPVGGGSSICSNGIALKSLNPKVKIIGVQAENAPAIYNSLNAGKMTPHDSADTFADGLATRVPFEYTFGILQDILDEMVLVSEEEMEKAIIRIFDTTHNIAEGAGAASTAAALKIADKIRGKKVVLLLSGGNLTRVKFHEILNKWN
ncbi:MAG: threonine/serine dehydratase [bacterium]|nr:threonine/serine dehydratase [bacterium]